MPENAGQNAVVIKRYRPAFGTNITQVSGLEVISFPDGGNWVTRQHPRTEYNSGFYKTDEEVYELITKEGWWEAVTN